MVKLTINLDEKLKNNLKQAALDETKKLGKNVTITDLVLPDIVKKYKNYKSK